MARSAVHAVARRSRILAAVLITLPLAAALAQLARRGPGPLVTAVSVAPLLILSLVSHLFCDLVGYRLKPVDPDLPDEAAGEVAVSRYFRAAMVRYAITMPVPALGLAASLATEPSSAQIFLLSALMVAAIRITHLWPTTRAVRLSEAALNSHGARVDLTSLLHWTRHDPPRADADTATRSGRR